MKHSFKRALALVIALMLAVPSMAFAEEPIVDIAPADDDIAFGDIQLEGDLELPGADLDLAVGDVGDIVLEDLDIGLGSL